MYFHLKDLIPWEDMLLHVQYIARAVFLRLISGSGPLASVMVSFSHQLDLTLPGIRVQMRDCLLCVGPWVCLWGIVLAK